MSEEKHSIEERFPGIYKANLQIALDNGGINRDRSTNQMGDELEGFINNLAGVDLKPYDDWLNAMSEDELRTVCCGSPDDEDDDDPNCTRAVLLKNGPAMADEFLDDLFENVC